MTQLEGQLRKAAVLVASLDSQSADALLEQMGEEQAARVRRAVMQLGEVDPAEQRRVIDEFLRASPLRGSAGVELEASLQRMLDQQPSKPAAETPVPPPRTAPPFRFLHDASGETIRRFLEREHPQTIALVIAHLPPVRAAEVIIGMTPELQADVLRRIAAMDDTPAEIVSEVEQELEALFSEKFGHRAAGVAAVRAILEAAGQSDRKQLLASLHGHASQLVSQMRPALRSEQAYAPPATVPPAPKPSRFTPPSLPAESLVTRDLALTHESSAPEERVEVQFDDLTALDASALATVFQTVDLETAMLALTGASRELLNRILSQLPPREARALERHMQQLGPLRLRDIEQAQQRVAQSAAQLLADGLIDLPHRRRFAVAA